MILNKTIRNLFLCLSIVNFYTLKPFSYNEVWEKTKDSCSYVYAIIKKYPATIICTASTTIFAISLYYQLKIAAQIPEAESLVKKNIPNYDCLVSQLQSARWQKQWEMPWCDVSINWMKVYDDYCMLPEAVSKFKELNKSLVNWKLLTVLTSFVSLFGAVAAEVELTSPKKDEFSSVKIETRCRYTLERSIHII